MEMIYIYCCKNRSELSQWDILGIVAAGGGGSFLPLPAYLCIIHREYCLLKHKRLFVCVLCRLVLRDVTPYGEF